MLPCWLHPHQPPRRKLVVQVDRRGPGPAALLSWLPFCPNTCFKKSYSRYNSHIRQFAHLKHTVQWILVYSQLGTQAVHLRAFLLSPKEALHPLSSSTHPQPPTTPTHFLCLWICLFLPRPVQVTSHCGWPSGFGFSRRAHGVRHGVWVRPCGSARQDFFFSWE